MAINDYNLAQDVISTGVLTKTNYEITSSTAAQDRNINAFVMEATSTGFLVNAKGTTTSTPLSAAFRNISNYFFSSSAANKGAAKRAVKIPMRVIKLILFFMISIMHF